MIQRPFSIEDWRASVAGRREMGRLAVIEAVQPGGSIERVITRMKHEVGFDGLGNKDQNVFNVMVSNLRRVAEGWHRLEERSRRDFVLGLIPYSALHKMVTAPDFYA